MRRDEKLIVLQVIINTLLISTPFDLVDFTMDANYLSVPNTP
jgi:hypothetical protein